MENNWKYKSLDALEKTASDINGVNHESYLIRACNELRKKSLAEFTVEDLRIMIGQNIGLKYLVPIAIDTLRENILAEGDYYQGDLLTVVLSADNQYWEDEKENWKTVCELFMENEKILIDSDVTSKIKEKWFILHKEFKAIN